ncbi:hypothetical protein QE152_g36490 [Popillia japonica]|uniref:Secreted protein n=1 Tax=Popillia japonica TaxID=7064 RepID=A0AAW1ICN4_POPJA
MAGQTTVKIRNILLRSSRWIYSISFWVSELNVAAQAQVVTYVWPRSGCPKTTTNDEMVDKIQHKSSLTCGHAVDAQKPLQTMKWSTRFMMLC